MVVGRDRDTLYDASNMSKNPAVLSDFGGGNSNGGGGAGATFVPFHEDEDDSRVDSDSGEAKQEKPKKTGGKKKHGAGASF